MAKKSLQANTTLFPVPVVLVTCGGDQPNVLTVNRVSSCNAEPPMLALSIRPGRYSHDLIAEQGEFVVNIPTADMAALTDYVGVTTGREEDKWRALGLTPVPASAVAAPLIAECPVNLECRVVEKVKLPSHTLFIGEVVAFHAEESVLDERDEVDLARFSGLAYEVSVVRERPVGAVNVDALRTQVTGGQAHGKL